MNKNMVKKVILVLSLIALFSVVLGGCTIIGFITIPTTGTVYITVDEDHRKLIEPVPTYYYNIFMDSEFIETIKSGDILEVQKVPAGIRFFEAKDVDNVHYYGSVYQEIFPGTNYVEIPIEFYYWYYWYYVIYY